MGGLAAGTGYGRPIEPAPNAITPVSDIDPGDIPSLPHLGLADDGCGSRQPGGRLEAEATLHSFLNERGRRYRREMSSPLTGETACSRLSPHLAVGTLSMREAAQATWSRQKAVSSTETGRSDWRGALSSFSGRLHWRCSSGWGPLRPWRPAVSIPPEGLRPTDPARVKLGAGARPAGLSWMPA